MINRLGVPVRTKRQTCIAPAELPLLRAKMPELDSLRGIAILMVLFYHGFASRHGTLGLSGAPRFLVGLTAPGWTGVNLFFALSGFLITGILLDTQHQPDYYRRFYLRRALRILPAYYALLALIALFGKLALVGGDSLSWKFLGLSVIYMANVTILLGVPLQFSVLWSLAVEEHFYLLWPLVVRNLGKKMIALAAILITLMASLARIITFKLGHDCFAHYTWLVADGLALGSLLAVLLRGALGTRKGIACIILTALPLAVALVMVDKLFGHPLFGGAMHITALNLFCTSCVALALALGTSSWGYIVNSKTLQFFGDISYGLYLIHMLIFNIFDGLQREFFPSVPPMKGHFGVMLVRFLVGGSISLVLAVLSRAYFEEPFLRLKDRLLPGRRDLRLTQIDRPATSVVEEAQSA